MLGINERLVGYVPQHEVTALDETSHLILFVHSATMKESIKSGHR